MEIYTCGSAAGGKKATDDLMLMLYFFPIRDFTLVYT